MNLESWVYLVIGIWIVMVVTHALTISYVQPTMQVVGVKEIIRTPNAIKPFEIMFLVDEFDLRMRRIPREEFIKTEIRKNIFRIIEEFETELFDITSYERHGNNGPETVFVISIQVLPPLKKNHENNKSNYNWC